MQTKNPTPPGAAIVAVAGGGGLAVKSFTDLSGALITKEIDSFADQVRKGIDNWRTAGKILVELSTRQPDIFRLIQARHPSISMATLQTFARIGRNEIWPLLIVDGSVGARKLLECPYDMQKEYAENPVKLAVKREKGGIRTVEKKVSDLTRQECAVVFNNQGGMNTLEKQLLSAAHRNIPPPAPLQPTDPAPALKGTRLVNVDIGYFKIVIEPDGVILCEPCEKHATAQPVHVTYAGGGMKTAIVLYYKQEKR